MTAHSYHPRTGELSEPILFDGCPRCEEAAGDPIAHCDSERVKTLFRHAVLVEHWDEGHYRSYAEKRACIAMWRIALFMERYGVGDPWTLFAEVPV